MTLPIRVDPIPGESLVSWLAAHATRMNCWWGEVLQIVLPVGADLGRVDRDLVLVGHLRDDQRDAIATATHTDAAQVEAMTLAGRYGQPLITIDPDSGRPDTPWGQISRQRFCPLCLQSYPGRDRMEWLLPWITTCPEHRCYLADACTHDGHHQCVSPTWFRLLAPPLTHRCRGIVHTPPGSSCGGRCTARLAQAPVDRRHCHDPVLDAQQTLTDWLSRPYVDDGLYASAPVGPDEVLQDILRLTGRLLAGADSARLIQFWGLRSTEHRVSYWDEMLRVHQAGRDNSKKSARVVAAPAAAVSAWVTTVMQILTKSSIAEAAEALQSANRIATKPAPERHRNRCLRYSTALTAADTMSRARGDTVFTKLNDQLNTALSPKTRVDRAEEEAMLRAVRGGLWTPWCLWLDTGILSWTLLCQTLTRLLLATGCTIAGHDANRRLHIHPRANKSIEVAARRLYAHPQWHVTHEALVRLSRYLSVTPPPIDYQRRRDIDYRSLLTAGQWNQLLSSHDLPLPSGPAGATVGRSWLTEQLGGPPARDINGKLIRRDGPRDVLRAHLTPDLLAAFDAIATDFLHTSGITDEPLRWTPPGALLDGLDLPGTTSAAAELEQADDLIAQGYTVMRACHALKVTPESVRYHLEQHPRSKPTVRGPKPRPTPALDWLRTVLPEPKLRDLYERKQLARHTILKIVVAEHGRTCDRRTLETLMQKYGIAQRAIPRPTSAWIHSQHVIGRRRLTDMAAELDVHAQTLSNYARRYRIPTHRSAWWYDQDPRSLQLLVALAIDPDTHHPRLASTPTWNDLQILATTSQYASFSAAARALDRSPCVISAHIRTLENVFGQRVCDRATRKHPITLTDFGQQLVKLTTAIDFPPGARRNTANCRNSLADNNGAQAAAALCR